MKNLAPYSKSTFEFHKKVLKSKNKTKKDSTYKNRVEALNDAVQNQFLVYDNSFAENNLEDIICHGHTEDEKKDLLKLYSYKNSVIRQLKIDLTTTETKRIINTCPNCTINEIHSLDHYLPQQKFPEFVVNPKNLFPSCTDCNGFKNDIVKKEDKKLFLNLYIDNLPSVQYLFVNFVFSENVISTKFYLQNNGTIDENLFELITTHYDRLHLLRRFSENSNEVITSLENSITEYLAKLTLEDIVEISIAKSNKDRLAFGHNYWKSILEISLLSCEIQKCF